MIQNYYHIKTIRSFSISKVWINGGSNLDREGKKGINKILSLLLERGCKGFKIFEFSEYIDSHGAELNIETFEDGILISLKSLSIVLISSSTFFKFFLSQQASKLNNPPCSPVFTSTYID